MYPRNAASPNQIAIGAVVQISDGAVQTSGCTVRILPQGGAEGDGGGTTAYSTDGVVLYTPTQAETNYTSFLLIAKKTGCIPASVSVVTTASATPGIAVVADTQKVDVNTIKTQAVTCAAGVTVLAQVGAAGAPGASNGLVTTNGTKVNQTVDLTAGQSIACSDKTGFSLSATGADLILKSSTFIQAIVAAVNEFATYGLTALNTLLVTTGIKTGSLAANAITATAIQDGAITNAKVADDVDVNVKTMTAGAIANATFAADVGSTALATNMVAKAAEKAIGVAGASLTGTGIPAATVTALGTGSGLTTLATAAELAKVPKSDSNVSWNATALAAINAEVDTALNTAIPGSPTADSINERIVAMDANADSAGVTELLTRVADAPAGAAPTLALTTNTVHADAGNTASSFQTHLTDADNYWNDALILITSGALAGQVKEIGDFANTGGVITLTSGQAFTGIPADNVTFAIINR